MLNLFYFLLKNKTIIAKMGEKISVERMKKLKLKTNADHDVHIDVHFNKERKRIGIIWRKE